MVDENDRARWDEAYRKAIETHDFIWKKPPGAPKDHKTMAEWLFDKYQQSLRWSWVKRFMLVQLPVLIASLAAIYGAAMGVYEGLQWLTELTK